MKTNQQFIYLILIFTTFLSSCKILKQKEAEIRDSFGTQSSEKILKNTNNIEITVSCGKNNDLEKLTNEGWRIIKEYSEEKICSWKSVQATKNCNLEKDKGCKIIKPDKIGQETIYLLEK